MAIAVIDEYDVLGSLSILEEHIGTEAHRSTAANPAALDSVTGASPDSRSRDGDAIEVRHCTKHEILRRERACVAAVSGGTNERKVENARFQRWKRRIVGQRVKVFGRFMKSRTAPVPYPVRSSRDMRRTHCRRSGRRQLAAGWLYSSPVTDRESIHTGSGMVSVSALIAVLLNRNRSE